MMVRQGRQSPGTRQHDDPSKFPLPSDTGAVAQDHLEAINQNQQGLCDNPGLWLDRFADYSGHGEVWERTQNANRRKGVRWNTRAFQDGLDEFAKRWKIMLDACGVRDEWRFRAEPEWRTVVGLGAESVLETSLRLHRIHGFPIIPGSGLKGLAAAYALEGIAQALKVPALEVNARLECEKKGGRTPLQKLEALLYARSESQERALEELRKDIPPSNSAFLTLEQVEAQCGVFRRVFGTTDKAGRVVFFDAVPARLPNTEPPKCKLRMKLDVMNPHYGDYYMEKHDQQGRPIPPADYLSPVPVYFLTVEQGSFFLFAVAPRNGDTDAAKQAKQWLEHAVHELGVGAKTSAGYGFWKVKPAE